MSLTAAHSLKEQRAEYAKRRFLVMPVSGAIIRLCFAIAIPFFQVDYGSLPLTVGILRCTMWVPFSWIFQHPVGLVCGVVRTTLIVIGWNAFPDQRFLVIPLTIVVI